MSRYNSANNDMSSDFIADSLHAARQAERVNEKLRAVGDIQLDIKRLDIIVNAMWELLTEKGYTPEDLSRKIDEIIMEKHCEVYQDTKIKCPKCHKFMQDSKSVPMLQKCLYCGHQMTINPYHGVIEEAGEELPDIPPADPEGYDPLSDLRFDEE